MKTCTIVPLKGLVLTLLLATASAVWSQPACLITNISPVCPGTTNTYTAQFVPGATYSWTLLDNTSGAFFAGNHKVQSVQVVAGHGGSYSLKLAVGDGVDMSLCTQAVAVLTNTQVKILNIAATNCILPPLALQSNSMICFVGVDQQPLSFMDATLSQVPPGYSVSDGTYAGWCVDYFGEIYSGTLYKPAYLYLSTQFLPPQYNHPNWDRVNYILNHKQGNGIDVQNAIWHFIGGPVPSDDSQYYPASAIASNMIADAQANGVGFVPGPGEVSAVIIDIGIDFQTNIIEVLCPGRVEVCPGSDYTFCAKATGTGPFTYEWSKNNVVIAGPNSNCLTVSNLTLLDSALYCLKVIGACNSSTGCVALVVTNIDSFPPTIICPPNVTVQCYDQVPAPDISSVAAYDNGGGAMVMFVRDTAETNGCVIVISRTYKATDGCANTSFCQQRITVHNTMPPVLFCAGDRIVECGLPWSFTPPTAFDLCDGTNVTVRIIDTVTNFLCGKTLSATRTWEAIDSCTNVATCRQTIKVVDTLPPSLTCAASQIVECGTPWNFKPPFATDVCDGTDLAVTIVSTVTNAANPSCPNLYSATRTWMATDACANSSMCSQTITVVDTEPPHLACGMDKEVQCGTDWAFDIPTAVDVCDPNNVLIEVVSTVTNVAAPRCPKLFSVTRTWRSTDTCGNAAFCNQTVTIVDTEPPNITCEQDKEVQCGTDWAFDIPTAVDKCDLNNVLIEVVSTVTNVAAPRCPKLFSVTRTWRSTDTCGNAAFCNQTVTIVDTEPPNITCEQDKEVQCGTDWAFDIPTAVDKCDLNNVLIEVVSTVTNVAAPRCPKLFSVTRTWRSTDTCGNAAFCNQTVTIVDTEPPNITCEQDKEVQCGTDWAFDIPTAVDKCDLNNVLIEVVSTVTNVAAPRCPKLFSVTRTWRSTDTCGNAAFCNQTVTIVDTEPPNITCEQDKEAQCGTDWAFDIPTAVDKCDLNNVLLEVVSTVTNVAAPRCPKLFSVTRTWRATDTCGNAAFCNQTVTIVDTEPPNLVCGTDKEAECGTDWAFDIPTASDLCDLNNVLIEVVSTVTNVAAPRCPKLFSVTRTWRSTDTCGNASFCNQTVTVVDTEPPNLTCGADKEAECGTDWAFDIPTAVDLCDLNNVLIEVVSTVTNVAAPRCPKLFSVTRTWRATDTCGNAAFCNQTVTIVDTLPPNLVCAADEVVECGTPFAFTRPTAVEVCDGNVVIEISSTVTNAGVCPVQFSVTRTWMATDTCGNIAFCNQTITVVDTLPPDLNCADDKVVECGIPWVFTPPTAVDICDGFNVTFEILSTVTNARCGSTFTATRTWQVRDACTNTATCRQTILVVDTQAPVIRCGPDRFVECGFPWNFTPPTALDVCSGANVLIEIVSTVTNTACGKSFLVTRTWKATDECTNSATCSQTIYVVDTTPPNLTCAPNRILESCTPWNFTPPSANDLCDGTNIVVTIVSTETNGLCGRTFVATRTWQATDMCGNSAVCSQTIYIVDTLPPTLSCAANRILECGTLFNFTTPAAFDICDGTNITLTIESTVTNPLCGMTFSATRTWKAIDQCSNAAICSQTIMVVDSLPPVLIGVPGNAFLMCLEDVPPPPAVTAFDLCDTNVTVTFLQTNYGKCPTIIQRCWMAIDDCSNSVTECQYIFVQPNPPVLLSGPADQVVCPGGSAQFCALVSSACAVSYQWSKDNLPIAGATNNCLALTDVQAADAGEYCIKIASACHVLTNCARLTVLTNIAVRLAGFCPTLGTNVALCPEVLIDGTTTPYTGAFFCLWKKDGVPVGGQYVITNCCLVITNFQPADSGTYEVEITGPCNKVLTNVVIPPLLLPAAVPISVLPIGEASSTCIGGSFQLCVPPLSNDPSIFYRWFKCNQLIAQGPNANCVMIANLTAQDVDCEIRVEVADQCNAVTNRIKLPCNPCVKITKTADRAAAPPGGTITYTYAVTNCGGLVLTNLLVVDDNATPTLVSDDITNVIALLQPGQTVAFTHSSIMPITLCTGTNGVTTGVLIPEILPNGNIKATFIQSTNVNDNTYGTNAMGWANGHTFNNLTGSDEAEFQFKDTAGQVVLKFKLDYISSANTSLYPAGYGTLGVTGGDGGMSVGNATNVVSFSTSLTENLNKQPFLSKLAQYTVHSPKTADTNSASWEYRMIYTVVVNKAAFGANGFGSVAVISQHNSPSKMSVPTPPLVCDDCVTNKATVTASVGAFLVMDMAAAVVCTGTNPPVCAPCVLGYPYTSANPRTSVAFNESEVLRAFSPSVIDAGDTIKVWYNDEHALLLGVRRVIVKNVGGSTTNNYPVTPLGMNPGSAVNPLVGATAPSGDQAGTDPFDRPIFPSLFITDITSDPNSKTGDWQFGGAAIPAHAVFGTWKAAVRMVDHTVSPPVVEVEPDADPAKNDWNLDGGDPAPLGLVNQGYGAEARWNTDDLGLLPGHSYRVQVMVHDGDQNKVGGDTGQACTTICVTTNPRPRICVSKEIACLLPGDNCSDFSKLAAGIKAGTQDPAFCYRITVTNCGGVTLTNVTVIDDKIGNVTSQFFGAPAGTLPAGGSVTRYLKMAWSVDTTNTVIASGRGAMPGGKVVTALDRAVALVDVAGLTCQSFLTAPCDLDGVLNDSHVLLPTNNTPCDVTFSLRLCNTGQVDLVNVVVQAPGCGTTAPFALAAGACADVILCTRSLQCSDAPVAFSAQVTADVVTTGHCAYDFNGHQIVLPNGECSGSVDCGQPPCFRLIKTADKASAPPGGLATYTYTLTNCGGVTLTALTVVDDNGTPGFAGDDFVVGTAPSLAPGATMDFHRTVTLPMPICADTTSTQTGLLLNEVLPNGNIKVTFIQGANVNDNTYGANAMGWGSKGHTFNNLTGSDQATFLFKNGAGQEVLEFKEDYISASTAYPSGYGTLGVTGGDGGMLQGSASAVLFISTSLTENLNKPPFINSLAQYTVTSPALSDPNSGLWEYRMIYTVVVDKAAFGASGFGSVAITAQHNSPAKMASFTPTPCGGCVTNIAQATATAGSVTLTQMATAVVCSTNPPSQHGTCPNKASFWQKNPSAWPAGYAPNQTVVSLFAKASLYDAANKTLLDAVSGKAGSKAEVKDLLKEAVAAMLNASTPGILYPMTTNDILSGVNMALMNGGNQALRSLKDLLKEANEDDNDCSTPSSGANCDTDGRPNVLTFRYNGNSCALATNSQMAIQGKTSCNGDPLGAPLVRIVATSSSTPPTASSAKYFDATVSLNQQFEVKSAVAGGNFGSNTYLYIYNGPTLVQTIQIHTSCSAPLRRGETFGSLVLLDYRIDP